MHGLALGLVEQADVAAYHWRVQCLAGQRHAADALLQLVVDVWPQGIPEIQAVGERQGPRAGATDVAANFGHRNLPSDIRVEEAVPSVPVNRDGDGLGRTLDSQHRSVAGAGANHGVCLHLVVILPVD